MLSKAKPDLDCETKEEKMVQNGGTDACKNHRKEQELEGDNVSPGLLNFEKGLFWMYKLEAGVSL